MCLLWVHKRVRVNEYYVTRVSRRTLVLTCVIKRPVTDAFPLRRRRYPSAVVPRPWVPSRARPRIDRVRTRAPGFSREWAMTSRAGACAAARASSSVADAAATARGICHRHRRSRRFRGHGQQRSTATTAAARYTTRT